MSKETTPRTSSPTENVGNAMRGFIRYAYGRDPTQDQFERMYWAWFDEVERIYGE